MISFCCCFLFFFCSTRRLNCFGIRFVVHAPSCYSPFLFFLLHPFLPVPWLTSPNDSPLSHDGLRPLCHPLCACVRVCVYLYERVCVYAHQCSRCLSASSVSNILVKFLLDLLTFLGCAYVHACVCIFLHIFLLISKSSRRLCCCTCACMSVFCCAL